MSVDEKCDLQRWVVWCATGVIGGFFLLVTSCTMYSKSVEPEIVAAEAEVMRAETELENERIKAVERLVNNGVHPILARCGLLNAREAARMDCATVARNVGFEPPLRSSVNSSSTDSGLVEYSETGNQ